MISTKYKMENCFSTIVIQSTYKKILKKYIYDSNTDYLSLLSHKETNNKKEKVGSTSIKQQRNTKQTTYHSPPPPETLGSSSYYQPPLFTPIFPNPYSPNLKQKKKLCRRSLPRLNQSLLFNNPLSLSLSLFL